MIDTLDICFLITFPLAFIIHDAEEIVVQNRWLLSHKDRILSRLPWSHQLIQHLEKLSPQSFAIAAIEELIIILGSCIYVVFQGPYAIELCIALFMAFGVHLIIHIAQAIVVRSYVPGLISVISLLPYTAWMVWNLSASISLYHLSILTIIGIVLMVGNLLLSHQIGLKLSN